MRDRRWRMTAAAASAVFMVGGLAGMASAKGKPRPVAPFIHVTSRQPFAATVSALKRAVAKNGMMVLGTLNQGKVMSITGLKMQGESFFVGNPVVGKRMFQADRAAGAEIPARVFVWVNGGGKTELGYLAPSFVLGKINPHLAPMGAKLNMALHQIVAEAAK